MPIQKWYLCRLQLATRLAELEPFDAVDLGEDLHPPRPRRPLRLVGIADRRRGVQVSLGCPRQHELPDFCRISPSSTSGVSGSSWPVSSANSRRATATNSSPASTSPFGIVQWPRSLFTQYGPPW